MFETGRLAEISDVVLGILPRRRPDGHNEMELIPVCLATQRIVQRKTLSLFLSGDRRVQQISWLTFAAWRRAH